MLERISESELVEWMAYNRISPIGFERMDILAAQICAVLANLHRDRDKRRDPYTLDDFILKFAQSYDDIKDMGESEGQSAAEVIEIMDFLMDVSKKGKK